MVSVECRKDITEHVALLYTVYGQMLAQDYFPSIFENCKATCRRITLNNA
jgi:hypothetical protein